MTILCFKLFLCTNIQIRFVWIPGQGMTLETPIAQYWTGGKWQVFRWKVFAVLNQVKIGI